MATSTKEAATPAIQPNRWPWAGQRVAIHFQGKVVFAWVLGIAAGQEKEEERKEEDRREKEKRWESAMRTQEWTNLCTTSRGPWGYSVFRPRVLTTL